MTGDRSSKVAVTMSTMSDSSDQRAFSCDEFMASRVTFVAADGRLLNQIYGLYDEAIKDKESEIFEITRNIQQIENVLNVVSKYGCVGVFRYRTVTDRLC